jgi:hypothetical protein
MFWQHVMQQCKTETKPLQNIPNLSVQSLLIFHKDVCFVKFMLCKSSVVGANIICAMQI